MANQQSPSKLIDQRIAELGDWRGATLHRVRSLIRQAVPDVAEEWKWRGVPVWEKDGIICTGETYKQVVKLTFAKGASLDDPKRLFNASVDGNVRRAIDIRQGQKLDAAAFKSLVKSAAALNAAKPAKVRLLSGGNPQIAKADGDEPVQAYIAALSGWKRETCRSLDALIMKHAPKATKAVKWNSPLYGMEGRGWFVSFHVFTRYVKVTFFNGMALKPVPPGGTPRSQQARWIDLHEGEKPDSAGIVSWIKQSSRLPGWKTGKDNV